MEGSVAVFIGLLAVVALVLAVMYSTEPSAPDAPSPLNAPSSPNEPCDYSAWKPVTGACEAGGNMREFRSVLSSGKETDGCTEPLARTTACKIDCAYADFGPWGPCNGGKRSRTRGIAIQAANGGAPCDKATSETEGCTADPTPPPCKYTAWEATSGVCEPDGTLHEARRLSEGDSARCTEPLSRKTPCKLDCGYTDYVSLGYCNENNEEQMSREVRYQAKNGGAPCDPSTLKKTRKCTCQFDEWYPSGGCTASGQKYVRNALSGNCRGETKTLPCSQDCQYSLWIPDSKCAPGKKGTMYRAVLGEAVGLGAPCNQETTKTYDCPVDCVMSEWQSGTCVDGKATDTRRVLTQPQFGGKECPADLSRTLPCNADCKLSDWYDIDYYESQDVGCGKKRDVIQHGQGAGKKCPPPDSTGADGMWQIRQCTPEDRPG